ncbi:MAG: hypothetical protein OXH76_03145 [Boseongicola sp.]|nr:hypothetical protein [Boseongicola sp.]
MSDLDVQDYLNDCNALGGAVSRLAEFRNERNIGARRPKPKLP